MNDRAEPVAGPEEAPHSGQGRSVGHLERGVHAIAEVLHVGRDGFLDGRPVAGQVRLQEGSGEHVEYVVLHLRLDVEGLSAGGIAAPALEQAVGGGGDHLVVARDPLRVDRLLCEAPLDSPVLALARDHPVSDHGPPVSADDGRVEVVLVVVLKDVLDVIGVGEEVSREEGMNLAAEDHDVPELAPPRHECGQHVAPEVEHAAEHRHSARSRRRPVRRGHWFRPGGDHRVNLRTRPEINARLEGA